MTYLEQREKYIAQRPAAYNFVRDSFADWAKRQPDETALFWTDGQGAEVKLSYSALLERASRAAAVLRARGVSRGDTVLIVLSRELEWWELVLGCLQIGAVVSPGTIQLTAKDIAYRMQAADAKAIITNDAIAEKVEKAAADASWNGVRITVGRAPLRGWTHYSKAAAEASVDEGFADTDASDPALCYFTSGTTGQPKLTLHRCDYPLAHQPTGGFWLGVGPGDFVWNISDTGWAKAAWSSLFAPWVCGAGIFALHADAFDAAQTLEWLGRYPITTLCAPPTAYRLFVRGDLAGFEAKALRKCVSAGEPLNPEVMELWLKATGLDIFEGYGQTETTLLCGTFDGMEIRPGSMGLPAPGVDLQIIDDAGAIVPAGEEGDIAVNVAAGAKPLGMFSEYKNDPERTAIVYRGDWYLTGDRAICDEDGYFWFVGRSDDVILSSGYRIGPFEVESALFEHPAVAESAVVASPDETRGEVVKAFVVLSKDYDGSDALVFELQDFVKQSTAPYKYPRKIEFVAELPKTISGKIKRKELKQQEWARGK